MVKAASVVTANLVQVLPFALALFKRNSRLTLARCRLSVAYFNLFLEKLIKLT